MRWWIGWNSQCAVILSKLAPRSSEHLAAEELIADGDKIAARFTMRGTHEGFFFGIASTGKKIEVQAMNFYRLYEGQIVEERGQPDLLGLMQQIGAGPA